MIFVYNHLHKLSEWAEKKADSCETRINKDKLEYLNILIFVAFSYCGWILFMGTYETVVGDHAVYSQVSNGAVCMDGWRSGSTGPGTCSHHGGVDYYVYSKERTGYHYSDPEFYFYQFFVIIGIFLVLSLLSRWFLYSTLIQLSVFLWIPFVPFMVVYSIFMMTIMIPVASIIGRIRKRKKEKTAANNR